MPSRKSHSKPGSRLVTMSGFETEVWHDRAGYRPTPLWSGRVSVRVQAPPANRLFADQLAQEAVSGWTSMHGAPPNPRQLRQIRREAEARAAESHLCEEIPWRPGLLDEKPYGWTIATTIPPDARSYDYYRGLRYKLLSEVPEEVWRGHARWMIREAWVPDATEIGQAVRAYYDEELEAQAGPEPSKKRTRKARRAEEKTDA